MGTIFFWVLCGIPKPESEANFEYFIIPASEMAKNILERHRTWLDTPGKKGQKHNESSVRTVHLPPLKSFSGWDISEYRDRWDLIEQKLKA